MRITDQYFWNFVFSVFFFILVVMGAIILETESRIVLDELSTVDFVLMTLATWRLTRLFVYDTITKFFREQFWDVVKVGKGYKLEKPKVGPRRTLADLLSCPWCVGLWMSSTVIFFYLLTPYAIFPIVMLAVGAVASFLQILSNLVGHKAETAKNQIEQ
jgi:fatty acid desaturase